jgi:Flp pilus assembly protein TadD
VLFLKTGRPNEAVAMLRRAIGLRPNLATLHENLGYALRATGDGPAAGAALEEALRLDPTLSRAREALAALRAAP